MSSEVRSLRWMPFRVAALTLVALGMAASCTGTLSAPPSETTEPEGPKLGPGEVCELPDSSDVQVRFEPSFAIVPPCTTGSCVTRQVSVIVDPDFCASDAACAECPDRCAKEYPETDCDALCQTYCTAAPKLTFESDNPDVVVAPEPYQLGLHRARVDLTIRGGAIGTANITGRIEMSDGTISESVLAVDVLDPALPTCPGGASEQGTVDPGTTLSGGGSLVGASISLPEGADKPNDNAFLWSTPAFPARISCAEEDAPVPAGHFAVGRAITIDDPGQPGRAFKREVAMSIPVNPARLPASARWRHLRVAYSGPAFSEPRVVPVADPRLTKVDGQWQLSFRAPRLGTYQAVVANDAGTRVRTRRITHRAVMGVSMGGGGTAMFGMRNHHLFDVLAPLGGPVDWTWMLHNIENNHLAGFPSIPPGTTLADIQLTRTPCTSDAACGPGETCVNAAVAGKCTLMPAAPEPYAHPQTFNSWWLEYPRNGTGGSFPRAEYSQIFRDLALMFGNPNSENLTPGAENLPAGILPDDPSQVGDHDNGECTIWVDPIEGHPDESEQKQIADSCPAERCAHTKTLTNYFDDEYNPDGTFPVITVCDGSPQNPELTPYSNTWTPEGNGFPLELALAVDYDGDGQRDEMEPIIRSGHERWDDWGDDGLPSSEEEGYVAGVVEDPAGDDYDAQYNPSGTEGDHRYQEGEPFDDYGLDGVLGTPQQPPGGWAKAGDGYDVGEGDGKLTVSSGLQRFWDLDAHSVVRRMTDKVPSGELDDEALARLDLWTDGGTRDLFNFAVDAQHLVGTFAARGRDVTYYTGFTEPVGLDPAQPESFVPRRIVYDDVPGIVLQRYGIVDPTPEDIEAGSGQHVGKGTEIANRLQTALYFIGSRWKEPDLRQYVRDGASKPAPKYETGEGDQCELAGNCEFVFESDAGRKGPVAVTLPPGYAHADQQSRRYPVIYLLHGYGQTPEDLAPAIVFLANWMNSPLDSTESRLPKAIIVYVDGRCRPNDKTGKVECIRGTFFTDSVRPDGAQQESWWLELVDEIDKRYRTMGPSEVQWTE
jgi:hypothetical protein